MAYSNFGSECVCGNNRPVPTINYLQGSQTPSKWFKQSRGEKFLTRQERFELFEKKTAKVYKEETDQELGKNTRGVVYVYMAQYPYTFEVEVNPTPDSRFEKMAVYDEKKNVRGVETFFASRTYWLEEGKVQVILDPEAVLLQQNCDHAARFIAGKNGMLSPEYKGIFWVKFAQRKRPYRVYKIDDKCIVMNLLNGAIFVIDDTFEMEQIVDSKFHVEEIILEKIGSSGNIRRF